MAKKDKDDNLVFLMPKSPVFKNSEAALNRALLQKFKEIVIFGVDDEDDISIIVSEMTKEHVNWLLDQVKLSILESELEE